MRTLIVSALVASSVASAQPAPADPALQVPLPLDDGPPGLQPVQLSPDDQALLAQGEISDARWLTGGFLAVFVSFGVGQAVQGRWSERGWIFTVGETASVAAVIAGVVDGVVGSNSGPPDVANGRANETAINLISIGVLGFAVFYLSGVIDAFAAPPIHNAHVRRLRSRLGLPQQVGYRLAPFVAPAHSLRGDATVAGFQLRF
jgi:hypothetical protein